MTSDHTVRDGMIHNAVEARRADETKIMQKVNAVNREAFLSRFPGQIEHNMRLISERLTYVLYKPEGINLSDTMTWPATPQEIVNLTQALLNLDILHQRWNK